MHDSLINRFRGGFLGMWLGEIAIASLNSPTQPAARDESLYPTWSQQTLTETDRWLGAKLRQPHRTESNSSSTADDGAQIKLRPDWLPMALLYHDQPQQLQAWQAANLGSESDAQANPAVMGQVIGQTISLILRERFAADELIPQVIRDLDLPLDLPLVRALLQVQSWLTQPAADLATVVQALSLVQPAELTLVLSFYSFLSSPEDFQIALLRLHRVGHSVRSTRADAQADLGLAGAILGAVAGIYNGLGGIPNVRRWLQPSSAANDGDSDRWEELLQRADQLLRHWSGVSAEQWAPPPHANLIAAPRVIRRAASGRPVEH